MCRNNSHANLLAFVETKNSNLEGEKYSKRKKNDKVNKDGCHSAACLKHISTKQLLILNSKFYL